MGENNILNKNKMNSVLLATKLFGTKAATAAGEEAVVDLQELAVNIFLKFIAVLEGIVIIVAGIVLVKFLKDILKKLKWNMNSKKPPLI